MYERGLHCQEVVRTKESKGGKYVEAILDILPREDAYDYDLSFHEP